MQDTARRRAQVSDGADCAEGSSSGDLPATLAKKKMPSVQMWLLIFIIVSSFVVISVLRKDHEKLEFIIPMDIKDAPLKRVNAETPASPLPMAAPDPLGRARGGVSVPFPAVSQPAIDTLQREQEPVYLETLISEGATVTASVRGNLGPPSVVTSPIVADWLLDRWQAAKNMRGEPIPGHHWLCLDLKFPAHNVSRFTIDYENAYSDNYSIDAFCKNMRKWITVFKSKSGIEEVKTRKSYQHVVHDIALRNPIYPCGLSSVNSITKVRLYIFKPFERWGTSVWSISLYGYISQNISR